LLGNAVYRVRGGVGKGLLRKGGLGFIPRRVSPEQRFIEGLDLNGLTVYDIGGYEGLFAIAFARAVGADGRVIVFEPNPLNGERIRENVRLNGFDNVVLRQVALGKSKGSCTLVFPEAEPARGSLREDYQASLRSRYGTQTIVVEVDSADHQMSEHALPAPDFVKIDVEASELAVLDGMADCLARHAPELFIEVHSGVDLQALVKVLLHHRYTLCHVESGIPITLANCDAACPGHLHGTASATQVRPRRPASSRPS